MMTTRSAPVNVRPYAPTPVVSMHTRMLGVELKRSTISCRSAVLVTSPSMRSKLIFRKDSTAWMICDRKVHKGSAVSVAGRSRSNASSQARKHC